MKKRKNNKKKNKEENYIYISEDIFIMLINYLFNTTKLSAEHYNKQFKYYKFLSLELELKLENTPKIFKKKIKNLEDKYNEATEMFENYLEKYIEECKILGKIINYINDS